MKETLQEMNAAEQQEENQREKEKSLTTLDHFRRGLRAQTQGREQDAMKEYTEAIRKDPNYAATYDSRGHLHKKLKDFEKALEDYNKAIELSPDNITSKWVHLCRASAYESLGQEALAKADQDAAAEL